MGNRLELYRQRRTKYKDGDSTVVIGRCEDPSVSRQAVWNHVIFTRNHMASQLLRRNPDNIKAILKCVVKKNSYQEMRKVTRITPGMYQWCMNNVRQVRFILELAESKTDRQSLAV